MIRRTRLLAAVITLALAATGCTNELRDESGQSLGLPVDINDHNTILGVAYDNTVPFALLLSGPGGASQRINGPGGVGFLPRAINDSGVIAGETVSGTGFQQIHRAVTWSAGAGFTTLPMPPGTFQSVATDINSHGTIVFNAYSPSGATQDGAYLWEPGDIAATRLPDPPGTSNGRASYAEAINDRGEIVGSAGYGSPAGIGRAVRWSAGNHAVSFLGAAGVNSIALDVNERGTAVGSSTVGNTSHAAAWLGATPVDLGPGTVNAVNDFEFAVGQAGSPPRAYLWSTVTRTAIPLGELAPGRGSNAVALNNMRAVGDSDGRAVEFSLPTP